MRKTCGRHTRYVAGCSHCQLAKRVYRRTHTVTVPRTEMLTAFMTRTELVAAIRALFDCYECSHRGIGRRVPLRCTHIHPRHREVLDRWLEAAWGPDAVRPLVRSA